MPLHRLACLLAGANSTANLFAPQPFVNSDTPKQYLVVQPGPLLVEKMAGTIVERRDIRAV